MRRSVKPVLLLAACLFFVPAPAQTIYKCKGPDGRYSYSNQPCAGDGDAMGKPVTAAPMMTKESDSAQATAAASPLPRQCDNSAMLKAVVVRLDSARTPDDVRPFLADERLRLLRCEHTRFTPEELRAREAAMADVGSADAARRRSGVQRVEALYERYMTAADRAARSTRQR